MGVVQKMGSVRILVRTITTPIRTIEKNVNIYAMSVTIAGAIVYKRTQT